MAMKCIRKRAACIFAVMVMLTSCGKSEPENNGIVAIDVVKNYEHKTRVEVAEPTPDVNIPPDPTKEPTPTGTLPADNDFEETNDTVYVAVSTLNLRKGPSTDTEIVAKAVYGDSFTRVAKGKNGWDKLLYEGQEVYAFADYLSVKEMKKQSATGLSGLIADSKKKMKIVDTSKQIYSYDEMCADLLELAAAYPEQVSYTNLAVTEDGRNVYCAVVGNSGAKKAVLIQAGIHAREYMTCMLVMNQLEFYLAYAQEAIYAEKNVGDMLKQVAFYIVPMVNPDGIAISQYGLDGIQSVSVREKVQEWYQADKEAGRTSASLSDYMKYWKANARGVDLNRNFSYGFREYGGFPAPSSQKYKGTFAGSEAETAALIQLTEEVHPVFTISYHATGSVIYWDYGQTGELRQRCEELVEKIHFVNGNEIRYAVSDKQDAAGYGDWCVMEKGIPSATIEIGVGAAPLVIGEYSDIWERNAPLWAALADFALSVE